MLVLIELWTLQRLLRGDDMLFRKTSKTKVKKIFRNNDGGYKTKSLYRVTTYWFLFLPVYSYDEFIS